MQISDRSRDTYGSYTADQLAGYYDMTPLYAHGDFGQGVHIAVVEFEEDSAKDIATYQSCYGIDATVHYTPCRRRRERRPQIRRVGKWRGGPGYRGHHRPRPRATIDVYQAPNNSDSSDVLDVYSAIINADTDQVVSTGWGECEQDSDPALMAPNRPSLHKRPPRAKPFSPRPVTPARLTVTATRGRSTARRSPSTILPASLM